MTTPNIFRYATKEISQDAFICWLVACASQATGDLQKCGLALVRMLFRAGASSGKSVPVLGSDGKPTSHDGPCDVEDVKEPDRQNSKIDVSFQAQVDGQMVTFVIEDKTGTRDHDDQLERYLESVRTDDQSEDLIKPVYFKTGYVFSNEREDVEEKGYCVLEAAEIKRFLARQPATRENEILRQYSENLGNLIRSRSRAQRKWDLDQDYVQWEFMLKLRARLNETARKWKRSIPKELTNVQDDDWLRDGLGRSQNRGGGSFTQYWFAQHLFWRLDSWKPLRLMIYLSSANMSVDEGDDLVQKFRGLFGEALQMEGLCAGDVRMRRGNESTLGSVDTAKFQGMNVDEFLDRVTRTHIRFLRLAARTKHSPGT
ncbi:MAG: PD-(D/E)XK nuclease family protein [Gemmatimonadaceae bacterium]|nr:PD-(D/E)XK nuclease family protein [Gemmatimonadaceae bacterium]